MRNKIIVVLMLLGGCASHIDKGDDYFAKAQWDDAAREYLLGINDIHGSPTYVKNTCERVNLAVLNACRGHLAKAKGAYLSKDYTTAFVEIELAAGMHPSDDSLLAEIAQVKSNLNTVK